ncbi:type I secretion system permease/ATPase [Halovulum sp. GXIMD14794]
MGTGTLESSARNAFRQGAYLLLTTFGLSFVVNVLRLGGPLFMILIYDRVLTSRSEETLFALFFMVVVLMVVLGLLDYARKRIVARFAAQFQERLEVTILGAANQSDMFPRGRSKPATGLDEADSLRGFFHSGGLIAVMDFLWTPMFVAVVFLLHPLLGYVCLGGMVVMLALMLIRTAFIGGREERSLASTRQISELRNMVTASRSVVRSQGMSTGFKQRWMAARAGGRDNAIALKDWTTWYDHLSSTVVLIVRYGVLATGAYLALEGKLTVGAMVASMFLVSRVLIPVNRFVGEIPAIGKAMEAWKRLRGILHDWDAATERPVTDEAGNPRVRLELNGVSVRSPLTGKTLLKSLNLKIAPGEMVEILGSSGRGKTVLAETIMGLRKRSGGTILCDGHNVSRMTDEEQAHNFGFVPEVPGFVDGTLAENISHLDPEASPEKIAAAARKACLHAWISALPEGYQTVIDADGSVLSKGQRQQVALARALYHEPKVLIVDEPDSMLLERLPETMRRTFDGILSRGGAILLLARKPLQVQQTRTRMQLEGGALVSKKKIEAEGDGIHERGSRTAAKTEPGRVTVLSKQKLSGTIKKGGA